MTPKIRRPADYRVDHVAHHVRPPMIIHRTPPKSVTSASHSNLGAHDGRGIHTNLGVIGSTSVLNAALHYVRRGWPVIPLHYPLGSRCSCGRSECPSIGKHPLTSQGLKDASVDEDQVLLWWHEDPKANIGLLTGARSGILVLDIDPRHGGEESYKRLLADAGAKVKTLQSKTGGGGRHILFLYPARKTTDIKSRPLKGYPGIDVKADGGYIVAPPSLHALGKRYAFAGSARSAPRAGVSEMPEALLRMVRSESSQGVGKASFKSNNKVRQSALANPVSVDVRNPGGVTEVLRLRYGIEGAPGTKVRCPECQHDTLQIKADNTIGKCFHPQCGLRVLPRSGQGGPQAIVSQPLREILRSCHAALVSSATHQGKTAYRYITSDRYIDKRVIERTELLGVVPGDSKSLFANILPAVKHELTQYITTEKQKKRASRQLERANEVWRSIGALRTLMERHPGWICFFHTDECGVVCSVALRRPYSKDFISWTFRPGKRGVFWVSVSPEQRGEILDPRLRKLIVVEGQFNALQLQSMWLKQKITPSAHLLPVCAVGGVSGADVETVRRIDSCPFICFDHDASGAGEKLVEAAQEVMCCRVFTTTPMDSDLDSFLCSFRGNSTRAWQSFLDLLENATPRQATFERARQAVHGIRRDLGPDGKPLGHKTFEINRSVAETVIEDLQQRGQFLNDSFDAYFFNRFDRALLRLDPDDRGLQLLLDQYGLNPCEVTFRYMDEQLRLEAFKNGERTNVHRLSYYDQAKNILYVSNAYNGIYRLTTESIEVVDNGTDGVLFLSIPRAEPINAPLDQPLPRSLVRDLVFGALNLQGRILSSDEQKIMVMFWFYGLFFEQMMKSKPLLALVGPKGSGKTSWLRMVGTLLEGSQFNVTPLSHDERDFDAAVANSPLVVIDNADTSVKWFNDRLATCATGSTLKKRELYTTNKLVDIPVKSFIALSARTPRFRRDDVSERLIVTRLERLGSFISENRIQEEVLKNRDLIFAEVLGHLQEILQALAAQPASLNVGNFRMADFAVFALRIGTYFGMEEIVRSCLKNLTKEQAHFTLEGDTTIELLAIWAEEHGGEGLSAVELHGQLVSLAKERNITFVYEDNPNGFAQRLAVIAEELEDVLDVRIDDRGGRRRVYHIEPKKEQE